MNEDADIAIYMHGSYPSCKNCEWRFICHDSDKIEGDVKCNGWEGSSDVHPHWWSLADEYDDDCREEL